MPAFRADAPGAEDALENLCITYWPPIYAFARKRGLDSESARDAVQSFFAHLLGKRALTNVGPGKGKLRSFLLACFTNFLASNREKEMAQKRGGGAFALPVVNDPDETAGYQPVDTDDPAQAFDRQWASTLVARVVQLCQRKWTQEGKSGLFQQLIGFINTDSNRGMYASVAAKLSVSEGSLRTSVCRLRKDFRDILWGEVNKTVNVSDEVDGEIKYLLSLFERR